MRDRTKAKTISLIRRECRKLESKALLAISKDSEFFVAFCFKNEDGLYVNDDFGAFSEYFQVNAVADIVLRALGTSSNYSFDIEYFCEFLKRKATARNWRDKGIDDETILRILNHPE